MRRHLCVLATLLAITLITPAARAWQGDADPLVKSVVVKVTSIAGSSIYLDKGRGELIESGDRVSLHPVGGLPIEVIIRSVSRNSARADIPELALVDGRVTVAVGDRGVVFVPVSRVRLNDELQANQDALALEAADKAAAAASVEVPEHPPWELQLDDEWDEDKPLLAPAYNRTPEEMPTRIRGRFYSMYSQQRDNENDSEYQLGNLGTDIVVENPFQRGGQIHLEGDLFHREADVGNGYGNNQDTTRFRLDRASYSWGGTRTQPDRWEVGRFLQHEFPELGVLDGVEYGHRMNSGNIIGGSTGYMPDPLNDFSTGTRYQAAVFYTTDSSGRDDFEYGIAYQNTWYESDPDRHLIVGNFDYLPHPDVSVHGGVWVDYYSDSDAKDNGFELTEASLRTTWRITPGSGVGVFANRIRYPDLQGADFQSTLIDQLLNNHVTRGGVDGWHRIDEHFRVDGSVAGWEDQDDTGGSGDARLAVRNLLYDRGEVAVGVFTTRGSYSEATGLRLSANKTLFERTTVGVAWEYARIDQLTDNQDFDADMSTLRASIDTGFGTNWNLSLFLEHRTGDQQDSYNMGAHVQQRF